MVSTSFFRDIDDFFRFHDHFRLHNLKDILKTMASKAQVGRDVIIAIDFGTTYSGFGYVFTNASQDHIYVFQKWGRGQGMAYGKTPTALLLDEKGKFCKFGHAAVETYAKLAMSKPDRKKVLYFDKFKLLLHSEKVSLNPFVIFSLY